MCATNEAIAELLIIKGADISLKDAAGNTILETSLSRGWDKIFNLLLDREVPFDIQTAGGRALMCAESEAMAETLILKGADISVRAANGDTILYRSISYNWSRVIKLLLDRKVLIDAKNIQGQTALHIAVVVGKVDIVALMLEQQVPPDIKNTQGQTALMIAESREIASLLIAKGADINAKDAAGHSVLHQRFAKMNSAISYSSYGGPSLYLQQQRSLLQLLLERGARVDNQDLMASADEQITELLIHNYADINAKDASGNTFLSLAVARSWQSVTNLLLDKGVVVDGKAIQSANEYCLLSLMEKGVNFADDALPAAVAKGTMQFVRHILDTGCRIDTKDSSGYTALMRAKDEAIAELLILKGADINVLDAYRNTPLHTAAQQNWHKVISILLTMGVHIDVKNAQGQTPLTLVTNEETALLLVMKNADIKEKDTSGNTIFHRAVQQNWRRVVTLLVERKVPIDIKNTIGQAPDMFAANEQR